MGSIVQDFKDIPASLLPADFKLTPADPPASLLPKVCLLYTLKKFNHHISIMYVNFY